MTIYNDLKKQYKQYNKILGVMKSIYEIDHNQEVKEYINYVAGLKEGIKHSLDQLR